MAALPYMQLYIADYLADTMHLSAEEHGAYLLLMFNYWQTGKPIPKSRLAKIARVSNDRWNAVETSLKEFFNDNGDEWIHERIESDLEVVRSKLEQKSAAGKASAAKRNAKNSTKGERAGNECSTGVQSPLELRSNENPTNKDPDKNINIKNQRESNAHELPVDNSDGEPPEKFCMHGDWQPQPGFSDRAKSWGQSPGAGPGYTVAQLRQFRDYWQAERAVKTHVQWEMAFAGSLTHQQAGNRERRRDINETGPVDTGTPYGFRGNNPHTDET
ncbi:DUF1376 domain-containing protein [Enterobacter ludwigii]|uniref:DUF1376 domain-containing protein n=1 Tax=Enterobacter ludwigii TaxID=299767 RepID=UPI003BEF4798